MLIGMVLLYLSENPKPTVQIFWSSRYFSSDKQLVTYLSKIQ